MPKLTTSSPICLPVSGPVNALIEEALVGRLAVCAGAGMSVGAGLPNGSELALLVHRAFDGYLAGYACSDSHDLVMVATAVESVDGLEALQLRIPSLAPFTSALPTLGHKLFALLLAEGAIRLLTTNWDDCFERGWTEELISVAATDADQEQLRVTHILKLHGCCKRPQTLQITEHQLEAPPFWAEMAIAAEIAGSTMVFVGIGDVAPYAQRPITRLAEQVSPTRVTVVSPGIVSRWDSSVWKEVLPALGATQRLAATADAFAEELARGWLHILLRTLDDHNDSGWMALCIASFRSLTALDALLWLRRSALGWKLGESVVTSHESLAALKAIAIYAKHSSGEKLVAQDSEIKFMNKSAVSVNGSQIEVMLAKPHQTATSLRRAARERAEIVANDFGATTVTVLCAATWVQGKLHSDLSSSDVLAGDPLPDDVLTGPVDVPLRLLWADEMIGAA